MDPETDEQRKKRLTCTFIRLLCSVLAVVIGWGVAKDPLGGLAGFAGYFIGLVTADDNPLTK